MNLWFWRWLLRAPWAAKRSNQSVLKEINPEYPLEGLMLKLWPSNMKNQLLRKDLDAGKDRRQEKRQQRIRWLDDITNSVDMSPSELWERVKDKKAWHSAVHGVTKSQTRLGDWTTSSWMSQSYRQTEWH